MRDCGKAGETEYHTDSILSLQSRDRQAHPQVRAHQVVARSPDRATRPTEGLQSVPGRKRRPTVCAVDLMATIAIRAANLRRESANSFRKKTLSINNLSFHGKPYVLTAPGAMHAGNLEFVVLLIRLTGRPRPAEFAPSQNQFNQHRCSRRRPVPQGTHGSVDPDLELDIYYAQRSRQAKTIKFISDVDSISFQVTPGQDQDFLIQVPDGRRARTRISTLRRPLRWLNSSPPPAPLTIPFTIGRGQQDANIQGGVNDSAPLDFMFDTGSVDNIVIFKSAIDKVPVGGLAFDGDHCQ